MAFTSVEQPPHEAPDFHESDYKRRIDRTEADGRPVMKPLAAEVINEPQIVCELPTQETLSDRFYVAINDWTHSRDPVSCLRLRRQDVVKITQKSADGKTSITLITTTAKTVIGWWLGHVARDPTTQGWVPSSCLRAAGPNARDLFEAQQPGSVQNPSELPTLAPTRPPPPPP